MYTQELYLSGIVPEIFKVLVKEIPGPLMEVLDPYKSIVFLLEELEEGVFREFGGENKNLAFLKKLSTSIYYDTFQLLIIYRYII